MPQDLLYDPHKVYSKIDYGTSILAKLFSFARTLPDLFIGGVQKGGTTSLYFALIQHPQIIPAKMKEIFYYNITTNYEKGPAYYKQFFATSFYRNSKEKQTGKTQLTPDATTHTLDCAEAPGRILKDNPNAKIIFMLRDPVGRAFSQYRMAVKLGFEKTSFEKALELEEERIKDGMIHELRDPKHNYAYQRLAYRKKGLYASQLKYWYNNFPKENILVLNAEQFYQDPVSVFSKLCNFLNIEANADIKFEKLNVGSGEKISNNTKTLLKEFYKPHNEELFKLLNTWYDW